ncbi:MAG TPA: hypothetical protein VM008_07420 [Phycisphaerae bacterium]|nr:hypothetical protein [Phycisphaerae bacterium]
MTARKYIHARLSPTSQTYPCPSARAEHLASNPQNSQINNLMFYAKTPPRITPRGAQQIEYLGRILQISRVKLSIFGEKRKILLSTFGWRYQKRGFLPQRLASDHWPLTIPFNVLRHSPNPPHRTPLPLIPPPFPITVHSEAP